MIFSTTREFNFDGLIGPTHNYAGLAQGNLASQQNRHLVAHPKQAALQGLEKMKFLAGLGVPQGVLPPQQRPHLPALRRLGLTGTDADILARAAREAPHLLAACCSASSMWAANAATISPAADTADGRVHITPANLISHLHRSLETPATAAALRAIFPGNQFAHHDPLPAARESADEGAANHSRLSASASMPGIEVFTFGAAGSRFQARQTRTAGESLARLHGLNPARTFFIQQNPEAIDAGAFHNDVLAVAHEQIFLFHERAYLDAAASLKKISDAFAALSGGPLIPICIPEKLLSLQEAVACYLFNSQIVTLPTGAHALIAPIECQALPAAQKAIDLIQETTPLAVHYIDVRQSMMNGGGPACLRLRVILTPDEQTAVHPGVMLTEALYTKLRAWIDRHYRDDLAPPDLADPQLLSESRQAMAELEGIIDVKLSDHKTGG